MTVARQSWRTVPRQRDPGARCHGIVYGFNILDPVTMQVRVDYVGKTVQGLDARERQHRGDDWGTDATEQPWSDLIVGKPFVVEEGLWTSVELDGREQFHIRRLRPRYNYEFNLANPDRIPIPVARQQREVRDRARGVVSPAWDQAKRPVSRPAPVTRRRRSWSRGQRRAVWLVALWLVLAVGGWVAAVHWAAAGLADGAWVGAVGSSGVYVVAWMNRPKRRRRKRR